MGIFLPPVIFVAGKKKAGKDFYADALVELEGYEKTHIAAPWLLAFYADRGYQFDTYEEVPAELKARYRERIQAEATQARQKNPEVLIEMLDSFLSERPPYRPLVISGVRFRNEVNYALKNGHFVVKVAVSDELRRQRFIAAGESLELFNDPFEADIDALPAHMEVTGDMPKGYYPSATAYAYGALLIAKRKIARLWGEANGNVQRP